VSGSFVFGAFGVANLLWAINDLRTGASSERPWGRRHDRYEAPAAFWPAVAGKLSIFVICIAVIVTASFG
jgi:hypothetical protein